MFTKLAIKNFKSITNISMELGRTNVLIGANGVGKSNLLEAVAMLAASNQTEIDLNKLSQAGVRVARPDLMRNSFFGKKSQECIEMELSGYGCQCRYRIRPKDPTFFMSPWTVDIEHTENEENGFNSFVKNLSSFEIYTPMLDALRGLSSSSARYPLGLHGEDFDVLLNMMPMEKKQDIVYMVGKCISWMESVAYDENDILRQEGLKLGRSKSHLFFRDKYMQKKMTMFSAENANEGVLVMLFYITLLLSDKTPSFFAVDNIDSGLNPKLCRHLMTLIGHMTKENGKQVMLTTHNPAFLDGMNLHDDDQRLFVVSRSDEGYTKVNRLMIKPAPDNGKKHMKLSEMWMNGLLGGVPTNF